MKKLHHHSIWLVSASLSLCFLLGATAYAHGVAEGDKGYITYPAIGHAAAKWGAPVTFTAAGGVCLLITAAARVRGQGASGAHTHLRQR